MSPVWKRYGVAAVIGASLGGWVGCQTVRELGEMGAEIAVGAGLLTEDQGASLTRTTAALATAFERLTPENEYYIGRAVIADLLGRKQDGRARYPVLDRPDLNRYVNRLGQALALLSDRPETFGGYRFLVIDADEINAFAAPGGLIVITRGMVRCCRSEDALAAVLAHEIGHVQLAHGLHSIEKSRFTGAWTTVLAEAGKTFGGRELAEAVKAFEGSISDVTRTLVVDGYSRGAERDADAAAVVILRRAGYDPHALVDMLEQMQQRLKPDGLDFNKTHPPPAVRIRDIRAKLTQAPAAPHAGRQQRFDRMTKGV